VLRSPLEPEHANHLRQAQQQVARQNVLQVGLRLRQVPLEKPRYVEIQQQNLRERKGRDGQFGTQQRLPPPLPKRGFHSVGQRQRQRIHDGFRCGTPR
jgi:hypothetical protein